MTGRIVVGVGAVVFRGDEVLVVQRGSPPFEGAWSIPGGKIRHSETLRDAVRREVAEETGIEIDIIGLIDVFEAAPQTADDDHYVLVDFLAEWRAGEPQAGDDALQARFAPLAEAESLLSWDETRRALAAARRMRDAAKGL